MAEQPKNATKAKDDARDTVLSLPATSGRKTTGRITGSLSGEAPEPTEKIDLKEAGRQKFDRIITMVKNLYDGPVIETLTARSAFLDLRILEKAEKKPIIACSLDEGDEVACTLYMVGSMGTNIQILVPLNVTEEKLKDHLSALKQDHDALQKEQAALQQEKENKLAKALREQNATIDPAYPAQLFFVKDEQLEKTMKAQAGTPGVLIAVLEDREFTTLYAPKSYDPKLAATSASMATIPTHVENVGDIPREVIAALSLQRQI